MPCEQLPFLTAQNKDERLSQLISLKRRELPNAAFWDNFSAELRSKRLATLVRHDPWHIRWSKAAIRLIARATLPITATSAAVTIVALTAVSLNYFASNDSAPSSIVSSEPLPEPIPQPLFVVANEQPEADAPNATSPARRPSATYQLTVMPSSSTSRPYQLNAAPVAFSTQEAKNAKKAAGARIITTEREF